MSIAIDGPAGAGKSTVAKMIAEKLPCVYVDTGAMYRAMALYLLRENVSPTDMETMSARCKEAQITLEYVNGIQTVWLNGEDVTGLIRTEEVGDMASVCGTNLDVRKKLVEQQQKIAERIAVVMEGRDICSSVLPNARVKVYLTASSKARAKRRYEELTAKGVECDLDTIEKDIIARDHRDMTREHSPLRQAEDAVLIDSSDMTIDEVVDKIISLV